MQHNDLEYSEAITAAQVQFAIHLLTPALNSYIRQTFPDQTNKDFADCCQFLLNFSPTHGRARRFLRMPLILRHRVAHQTLNSFRQLNRDPIEHFKVLAVFIDRQDLKNKICCFVSDSQTTLTSTRTRFAPSYLNSTRATVSGNENTSRPPNLWDALLILAVIVICFFAYVASLFKDMFARCHY
jgi:hypothetical protein